jgi:serine/threonine-protein kinase HipA
VSAAHAKSHLVIWLNARHVADLYSSRGKSLSLVYTEEAIGIFGLGGLCLSVALPVRRSAYSHEEVFPWVEGLLPEGETRTVLEREFQVRRGDTFGLLAKIGRDCAGAVSFYDPGVTPESAQALLTKLTGSELDEAIISLPARPLGADGDVRVSLGGIQAKLLLVQTPDGGWARPSLGNPSTHILKPEPAEYPGLAAAEVFALRAAAACSISSAEASIANIAGKPVIVVRRFDRIIDDAGQVARVHQEDAGQALSLDASNTKSKYQYSESGPPSLAQIADVIRTHGKPVREGLLALLQMVTFNVAIGNTDAHARNYSFMFGGGGVFPAPLYDTAPTRDFVSTNTLALWVDGQAMLSVVSVDHIVEEAMRWSIPKRVARTVVNEILGDLPGALARAAEDTPEVSPEVVESTIRRVEKLQFKSRLPRNSS